MGALGRTVVFLVYGGRCQEQVQAVHGEAGEEGDSKGRGQGQPDYGAVLMPGGTWGLLGCRAKMSVEQLW